MGAEVTMLRAPCGRAAGLVTAASAGHRSRPAGGGPCAVSVSTKKTRLLVLVSPHGNAVETSCALPMRHIRILTERSGIEEN